MTKARPFLREHNQGRRPEVVSRRPETQTKPPRTTTLPGTAQSTFSFFISGICSSPELDDFRDVFEPENYGYDACNSGSKPLVHLDGRSRSSSSSAQSLRQKRKETHREWYV